MIDIESYDDASLMKELKADNMFAFDFLYKRYSKRIYRFACSILKSPEDAENVVQDVFLNLWEKRHQIEKDSSIKSYVFSITYNASITIIRKRSKELQFNDYIRSLQYQGQEPANIEVEYNELTKRLDKIINDLPKRQKEIYLLTRVEGLKYQEVANKLKISVNTIENHMSRALKTIRERLGNYSLLSVLFYILFI